MLLVSYITYSFGFVYCVHHIDTPKTKSLYSYFLNKLNKNFKDEDNFIKLMTAWIIIMSSFGLIVIGIGCILIGIIK